MLRSADDELMSTSNKCCDIKVEVRNPDTGAMSVLVLRGHVYGNMMCAMTTPTTGGQYICYGNTGGAVLLEGDSYDADLACRVLSWGYGCMNRDHPAVVTRVLDHYDWIRETVCRKSSAPPEQYDCTPGGGGMSRMIGGYTQMVTLKLKLDTMAVETGFVIEVRNTQEVVAQHQMGHYKEMGNQVVFETMHLPSNQCYRLVLLDSYGNGFCCNMGGRNALLFLGTDIGHTTGHRLVEVNGNFKFDNSGKFCLTGGLSSQEANDGVQPASSAVLPPSPPTSMSTSDANPMFPPPPPEEKPYGDDD
jgi:hypothetical protein